MNSYSIIVETENLSAADSERLWGCLLTIEEAVKHRSPPNEVVVFDTRKAPSELLERIRNRFSWLVVRSLPAGQGYYECKMEGALAVDSDIIVLADSDCLYEQDWLHNLLAPFEDPAVDVVAGETAIQGTGPYTVAMAIAHAFDGFSGEQHPSPSNGYYANNVAFKRSLLVNVPIPQYTAAYRNACYIHSIVLRRRGIAMLRQPSARAHHAAPENLPQFVLRFLLSGADKTVRRKCGIIDDAPRVGSGPRSHSAAAAMRLRRAFANGAGKKRDVPLALVVAGSAYAIELAGFVWGYLFPNSVIRFMTHLDGNDRPSIEKVRSSHSGALGEISPLATDRDH